MTTPSTPTGEALIARLEAATGPAIFLDAELFWLFRRADATRAFWRGAMGLPRPLPNEFSRLPRGLGMASMEVSAPKYTSSLDAALALAERVLPERRTFIEIIEDGRGSVCMFDTSDPAPQRWMHGATPPLALCAAILRATGAAQ